ncbi:hypothetical protein ANN_26143 [Periplaneta americana]|uniref:Uncharacterized protein n=1 Tax=Periplaneta americana TaxID=6978 RepID=A0ABQ8S5G2_PERAM|nr:hypothetical protein ANN_26143 [Periplaneta americana]
MDLREVGYDDRDWINLAQDRDRWRAYLSDYAMNYLALERKRPMQTSASNRLPATQSKDGIVDELLDSFVINLEESDTGTDTDECEETDGISIFMEAGPSATGCMDGIAPLPQSP